MKHILTIGQFEKQTLIDLMYRAYFHHEGRNTRHTGAQNKILTNLFYEPSTRNFIIILFSDGTTRWPCDTNQQCKLFVSHKR